MRLRPAQRGTNEHTDCATIDGSPFRGCSGRAMAPGIRRRPRQGSPARWLSLRLRSVVGLRPRAASRGRLRGALPVAGVLHGQRFGRDAHGILSANRERCGTTTPEQVAARRQEIEDVRRNLEHEEAELDATFEPPVHRKVREVQRQIETDETGYLLFDRASQRIAAAALLTRQLPEPATTE